MLQSLHSAVVSRIRCESRVHLFCRKEKKVELPLNGFCDRNYLSFDCRQLGSFKTHELDQVPLGVEPDLVRVILPGFESDTDPEVAIVTEEQPQPQPQQQLMPGDKTLLISGTGHGLPNQQREVSDIDDISRRARNGHFTRRNSTTSSSYASSFNCSLPGLFSRFIGGPLSLWLKTQSPSKTIAARKVSLSLSYWDVLCII